MRFEDPNLKREQRRAKFTMVLACGSIFTVSLVATSFVFIQLGIGSVDPLLDSEFRGLKMAGIVSFAIMVGIADRLGKYLKLSPQNFAGPVAFGCTVGVVVLLGILMARGMI